MVINSLAIIWARTVSYTHLDVYKRQIKSGTSYYFLYKGKIGDHLDELSTESGRMSVLAAMKQDEFQERMEKETSEYSCTMNDAAVSNYQPCLLYTSRQTGENNL